MKTADKIKQLKKIKAKIKKQYARQGDAGKKLAVLFTKGRKIDASIKGRDRELYAEKIVQWNRW